MYQMYRFEYIFLNTNETMTTVGTTSTMIGRIDGNKFYADTDVLEGLRDGIEIGASYARKLMIESFKPMSPYFKCNKENTKDLEVMTRICEKEYKKKNDYPQYSPKWNFA